MVARLARRWLCLRLFLGCNSCVSVSRLLSADVSLYLTGPGAAPAPTGLYNEQIWEELAVFLFGVTDSTLAGVLPALPGRLPFVIVAGEQRQHYRVIMYVQAYVLTRSD